QNRRLAARTGREPDPDASSGPLGGAKAMKPVIPGPSLWDVPGMTGYDRRVTSANLSSRTAPNPLTPDRQSAPRAAPPPETSHEPVETARARADHQADREQGNPRLRSGRYRDRQREGGRGRALAPAGL